MPFHVSSTRGLVVVLALVVFAAAAQAGAPQVSAQEDSARPFVVILTLLGWAYVAKSLLFFVYPPAGLRSLSLVSLEKF